MRYLTDVNQDVIQEIPQSHVTARAALQDLISQGISLKACDLVTFVQQWPPQSRDLTHMNFANVDMSECDAHGLNFNHSDFTLACLRSAQLRHSSLKECVFAGTILDAANMHACDLSHSMIVEHVRSDLSVRDHLRPTQDQLLPHVRVMARAVDLESACLDACLITHVDFTAASFTHVSMQFCLIEKCTFDSAIMHGVMLTHSLIYRSDLCTSSLTHVQTQGSVFRNNEYMVWPSARMVLEGGFRMPQLLHMYVHSEWSHYQTVTAEVKQDYRRQIWLRLLVMATVPVLVLLAWHYVETNWVMSVITAVGAMSTVALRRYVIQILQGLFGFTWGKLNDAEGLWRSGVRGKALMTAICNGTMLSVIHEQRKNNPPK
jgi:uncharacterized protein YjbI with pentapeptide repeats